MSDTLGTINSVIWGGGLVSLILLTGVIYTIKLKGIQFRLIPELVSVLKRNKLSGGRSQFKTVSMALGSSMGTGNIIGVASALALGGAGAVFWMWISALLGMAVVYAENSLSSVYSNFSEKGPIAYIKNGLGCPVLAVFFAVMCIGAAFGMGGMVQVNSAVSEAGKLTGTFPILTALAAFILIYMVVSGGAERIGSAARLLLPAVTIVYTCCCFAVIIAFRNKLPEVFTSIFKEAFSFRNAAGGTAGYAVTVGMRRGVFSNEAGLGSSPLIHSAAEKSDLDVQGTFAMLEVFIDTIFCCTLTALTILCASPDGSAAGALSFVLGDLTELIMPLLLTVFSFCTVIGWYYCGETAFLFLRNRNRSRLFPLVFSATVSLGAVLTADVVWTLSDIFNGLMAFPNLAALLLLRKKIRKE